MALKMAHQPGNKIAYSKDFVKAAKLLRPAQKIRLKQRIALFLADPAAGQLRNHKLAGQWHGYSSINISGDLRAVYTTEGVGEIYFVALVTHAQLYK